MNTNTPASFLIQAKDIVSTFNTDTIYVLGKGPSIDRICTDVFAGSLVIGINDAERIVPADITIFHEQWVSRAIQANGERSQMYISSTDFVPSRAKLFRASYIPTSQDGIDLMFQRLLSIEIAIEETIFITALQICRHIADFRKRTQTIYMVGFDFNAELGLSSALTSDYSNSSMDARIARIAPQEHYLINALYLLNNTNLDVIHVGNKPYSRISINDLNSRNDPTYNLSDEPVPDSRISVVAEVTTNHFGQRYRLEQIIRLAKAAGADYIKLQKRDVDSFYSSQQLLSPYYSPFGNKFGDYRHAIELTQDDFQFVDALCRRLGIKWFASVLDRPSYEFVLQYSPKLIKIPGTISRSKDFIASVAAEFLGSVVVSTGMTNNEYEEWIISKFAQQPSLYLLQCSSAYPPPPEQCNVAVVRRYHRLSHANPRIVPGYSSHDSGWFGSVLAVAAGARIIEKHVKLGSTEWAHFDAVAIDLTTPEFSNYVLKLREAEVILGSEEKAITQCEFHKY